MDEFDQKMEISEQPQEEIVEKIPGRDVYETVSSLVSALLVVVLVFTFLVRLMGVSGPSMIPTLQDGDRLLVVNSLLCGDYQVGDIVIARKETFDSKPIVKRVIATAGQTVDIDFNLGQVYVDGELLDEDYINDYTYREEGTVFPLTVPEGEVFLMGDNRNPFERQPRFLARHGGHAPSDRQGGVPRLPGTRLSDRAARVWPHRPFAVKGDEQMQLDSLSWFPGHMTKTRRMITAELGNVDAVCEILDARIPMSSRNPDVDELTAGKPRLIVLNRVDQADPEMTKKWAAYFRSLGCAVIETDAKQGGGVKQFSSAVRTLLHDKIASYEAKGQIGRVLRVMVLGIPNVGKSTFINKVSGRKSAKAEDRPGVTRTKQWVPVDKTLELLDTPGILWPKFEDSSVGVRLAFTGAIRDEVIDIEELAMRLMDYLGKNYPKAIEERYKLTVSEEDDGYALLEKAGRKRGFLISGRRGGHRTDEPHSAR